MSHGGSGGGHSGSGQGGYGHYSGGHSGGHSGSHASNHANHAPHADASLVGHHGGVAGHSGSGTAHHSSGLAGAISGLAHSISGVYGQIAGIFMHALGGFFSGGSSPIGHSGAAGQHGINATPLGARPQPQSQPQSPIQNISAPRRNLMPFLYPVLIMGGMALWLSFLQATRHAEINEVNKAKQTPNLRQAPNIGSGDLAKLSQTVKPIYAYSPKQDLLNSNMGSIDENFNEAFGRAEASPNLNVVQPLAPSHEASKTGSSNVMPQVAPDRATRTLSDERTPQGIGTLAQPEHLNKSPSNVSANQSKQPYVNQKLRFNQPLAGDQLSNQGGFPIANTNGSHPGRPHPKVTVTDR